jgi:hypothetical protein
MGNPPQEISVRGTVTGLATHLGRFRLDYIVTVSLPKSSSTGSAELTADGDKIFTTIVGQGVAVPDIPGLTRIVEFNTITGGTGRFAGATGTFIVERLAQSNTNTQLAPTSGSLQGTIISSDAAH